MTPKSRSTTLNTVRKKNSPVSSLTKQLLVALIVIIVTVNLLVVFFNFLLTLLGEG